MKSRLWILSLGIASVAMHCLAVTRKQRRLRHHHRRPRLLGGSASGSSSAIASCDDRVAG